MGSEVDADALLTVVVVVDVGGVGGMTMVLVGWRELDAFKTHYF